MPWLLKSPGHQHPSLCTIGKFLSYMRKVFNYRVMSVWRNDINSRDSFMSPMKNVKNILAHKELRPLFCYNWLTLGLLLPPFTTCPSRSNRLVAISTRIFLNLPWYQHVYPVTTITPIMSILLPYTASILYKHNAAHHIMMGALHKHPECHGSKQAQHGKLSSPKNRRRQMQPFNAHHKYSIPVG